MTTPRPRALALLGPVAFASLIGIATETSEAVAAFAPVIPPNCSTDQWLYAPYRYKVGGNNDPNWLHDVADNPYQAGSYLPSIHMTRRVFANAWVKWFDFYLPNFSTESYWDWFPYGKQTVGDPGYWLSGPSGVAGYWYMVRMGETSLQSNPGYFVFESNAATQLAGLNIDGIRVCSRDTKESSNNANTLHPFKRETGVLLGTGDVVYFRVTFSAGAHQTFALWGDYPNDIGKDFDLYLRCGLPPTESDWDYRGFSGDTNEFSHVDLNGGACQAQWWAAVHSYSGAGMFNVMVNEHYQNSHYATATANVWV